MSNSRECVFQQGNCSSGANSGNHVLKSITHIQGNLEEHFTKLSGEARANLAQAEEEIDEFMSKNLVMRKILANSFDKDREKWQLEAAELLSLEIKSKACEIALSTLREVKTLLQDAGTELKGRRDGMLILADGVKKEVKKRSQGDIADSRPVPFTENLHVPDMLQAIDHSMLI